MSYDGSETVSGVWKESLQDWNTTEISKSLLPVYKDVDIRKNPNELFLLASFLHHYDVEIVSMCNIHVFPDVEYSIGKSEDKTSFLVMLNRKGGPLFRVHIGSGSIGVEVDQAGALTGIICFWVDKNNPEMCAKNAAIFCTHLIT